MQSVDKLRTQGFQKLHKYIFLLRPVTLFYLAGAVLWIGLITDFWKWSAKDWNFIFVGLVVGVYL